MRTLTTLTAQVLKGYDQLCASCFHRLPDATVNLVLDDVREPLRDPATGEISRAESAPRRTLGLVVVRGPTIVAINPADASYRQIENPF